MAASRWGGRAWHRDLVVGGDDDELYHHHGRQGGHETRIGKSGQSVSGSGVVGTVSRSVSGLRVSCRPAGHSRLAVRSTRRRRSSGGRRAPQSRCRYSLAIRRLTARSSRRRENLAVSVLVGAVADGDRAIRFAARVPSASSESRITRTQAPLPPSNHSALPATCNRSPAPRPARSWLARC